jgi:hypothetical protein
MITSNNEKPWRLLCQPRFFALYRFIFVFDPQW